MRKPDWKKCTAEQMWQYVASHLAQNDIDTVLVGGSVVSIYSEGAYTSGDLDLVVTTYRHSHLSLILKDLGFKATGRYYAHPECKHLFLEFLSPPLGIGDDTMIKPDSYEVDGQKILILSPTDCIRDRLASYIHFKARECLDQALLVAQRHPFSLKKVKSWCLAEGGTEEFKEFERALKGKNHD